MSFCEQCGKELVGARKFCKFCGRQVTQTIKGILNEKIPTITDGENKEITNPLLIDSLKIITDEHSKDALDFKRYSEQFSKLIVNSIPQFTVGIYGGWGTGKTTLMQMMQDELRRKKYSDKVEVIWFDAWRYEKEEYSAMIPLLRTIILSFKDDIEKSGDGRKKKILSDLEKKVTKISEVFFRNLTLNLGVNLGVTSGGANLDIGKSIDDYRSDGSFLQGQQRTYFHKHITDHLKEELQKIREDKDFRIVIFVDDLDRCTPERALELIRIN